MILLVGTSVRALMESAVESGYEVMGIDFFGDADAQWQGKTINLVQDCGLQPTVKNLFQIAKTIPCEGLVYASGPENSPGELVFWEEQGLLRGNSPSVLTKVRNPWNLKRSLDRIQEKMPRFYPVERWRQCEKGKRWILKPLNRGGGHGIMELPPKEEDIIALVWSLPQPVQYIIQEYIEGISGSVTFLANGQETVVLGTSRQLIGRKGPSRPFCYEGNIAPLELQNMRELKVFEKEITTLLEQLTKDFGLRGMNTLDFIVNEKGIWVLELNPRWSASVELIEKRFGKRLFASHLAGCQGKEGIQTTQDLLPVPAASPKNPKYRGKAIVYARSSLIIQYREENEPQFLYQQGIRDIPQTETKIEKGQPLCTVLAAGVSDRECCLTLRAKADWVQNFLERGEVDEQYRRSIDYRSNRPAGGGDGKREVHC